MRAAVGAEHEAQVRARSADEKANIETQAARADVDRYLQQVRFSNQGLRFGVKGLGFRV
jgi:hypothetical protein